MAQYLSAESILVIHSEVVDATGGSHGVRDTNLLAVLADKLRATFDGKGLYCGIFKKAAVYLESIVNYHVFVEGNKRTGITACARLLFVNGYELSATNRAVESLVLSVATEKPDIDTIAKWLEKHTEKVVRSTKSKPVKGARAAKPRARAKKR